MGKCGTSAHAASRAASTAASRAASRLAASRLAACAAAPLVMIRYVHQVPCCAQCPRVGTHFATNTHAWHEFVGALQQSLQKHTLVFRCKRLHVTRGVDSGVCWNRVIPAAVDCALGSAAGVGSAVNGSACVGEHNRHVSTDTAFPALHRQSVGSVAA